jgi:hypothetical protein
MAAKCSGRSAPRAVIRVSPTSMTTSISSTVCAVWRGGRLNPLTTTGRSCGRSDRVVAPLRARRASSERHHTSVRARTPSRLAIASGSAPPTSSSTRFAHQAALCLAIPAGNYVAPSKTRRPSPYGYTSGAGAVKSRATRFGAMGSSCRESVVTLKRRRLRAKSGPVLIL